MDGDGGKLGNDLLSPIKTSGLKPFFALRKLFEFSAFDDTTYPDEGRGGGCICASVTEPVSFLPGSPESQ